MSNKIKNIVLIFIAIFMIGMGFLGFHTEQDGFDLAIENDEKTGDVQLVNSEVVEEVEKDNQKDKSEFEDYFSESRIEREKNYSQMVETYQNMIDSSEISSEQKSIAIEEIKKIENQKNAILISENLIKNKGFDDVVIFINDKSISCVIKSNISLLTEQVAQIQNIISRELKTEIANINISNR